LVLSIIFGLVALAQVRRRGQRGRGFAVAGLTSSAIWIMVWVILFVVSLGNSAGRDGSGAIDDAGTVTLSQLRTGDCVNGMKEGAIVLSVDSVTCASPHQSEVFAIFTLPIGPYPGDAEAIRWSESGCVERLEVEAPSALDDETIALLYLYPQDERAWRRSRLVICFAVHDTPRTGSIRG
jgi:hypothetical protein